MVNKFFKIRSKLFAIAMSAFRSLPGYGKLTLRESPLAHNCKNGTAMATEKQSHRMAGLIVEHQLLFEGWPKDDLQWAMQNMQEGLALYQEAVKNRDKGIKEAEQLLRFESVVPIPNWSTTFVARECFVVNIDSTNEYPVSYMGTNFQAWFLDKVEEPAGGTALQVHELLKASKDAPIIKALGGEDQVESTLQEMYTVLKSADRKKWYIFYVKDAAGVLRAVSAYWYDDGWNLGAYSVGPPLEWRAGDRVVSRKRS